MLDDAVTRWRLSGPFGCRQTIVIAVRGMYSDIVRYLGAAIITGLPHPRSISRYRLIDKNPIFISCVTEILLRLDWIVLCCIVCFREMCLNYCGQHQVNLISSLSVVYLTLRCRLPRFVAYTLCLVIFICEMAAARIRIQIKTSEQKKS